MDFMSDPLFDGRRQRAEGVDDRQNTDAPAIDVRQSYRGLDLVETLEQITRVHGKPQTLRVDNGPEFICKALVRSGPNASMLPGFRA